MKTTTTKIATTFTAAIKAGATGIVSVISADVSSRLRWRHVSVRGSNPGVVGQHRLAWLAGFMPLAMRPASPAGDACLGCRPYSVANQLASI